MTFQWETVNTSSTRFDLSRSLSRAVAVKFRNKFLKLIYISKYNSDAFSLLLAYPVNPKTKFRSQHFELRVPPPP